MNSSRFTRHITAWFPPLCLGLAILILSGDLGSFRNTLGLVSWLLAHLTDLSPERIATLHGFLRIGGHMLVYGTLYFLWFRAFETYWPERRWPLLIFALLCILAVGMLDEGHQSLVGSRRGSVYHIGWDLAGASLSALLILTCRKPKAQAIKGSG